MLHKNKIGASGFEPASWSRSTCQWVIEAWGNVRIHDAL